MTFDEWYESLDHPFKRGGGMTAHQTADWAAAAFYAGLMEGMNRRTEYVEVDKGLPGVTEQQVAAELMKYEPIGQGSSVVARLADWFNDPNRDAPVKPTMHPDLEWLASLPEETIRRATIGLGGSPLIYRGSWGINGVRAARYAPADKQAFTLTDIELARKHLAKPTMTREGALEALRGFFCYEPQAYRNAIVSDMAADPELLARALQFLAKDGRCTPQMPPHVGVRKDVGGRVAEDCTPLDLNNLPNYETWFEEHGTTQIRRERDEAGNVLLEHFHRVTTVHELYTHFRARLLDELRQAGVIGDDQ